jgi:hypothetical protein
MITSILEFFALGTLGFWILCSLISVIFIIALENENHWFPTCLTLAFAGIYWKALAGLALSWHAISLGILVYAVIGIVWSMFRWFRYVKSTADTYRKEHGDNLRASERSSLQREISATLNKSRITGWIAYWPWSMLWNLTGDFFKMIYEALQGVYQKISDRAMGKFGTISDSDNRR